MPITIFVVMCSFRGNLISCFRTLVNCTRGQEIIFWGPLMHRCAVQDALYNGLWALREVSVVSQRRENKLEGSVGNPRVRKINAFFLSV